MGAMRGSQASTPAGGCTATITPTSAPFDASGAPGGVTVTLGSGCPWTAVSNTSWITITGNANGSGTGGVSFVVAANSSQADRQGTLAVAGQVMTVTQSASTSSPAPAPACSYTVDPLTVSYGAAGGSGSLLVVAAADCAWKASTHDGWIKITAGLSSSASGLISYNVDANGDTKPRTGTLSVAGETVTIAEAGKTKGS